MRESPLDREPADRVPPIGSFSRGSHIAAHRVRLWSDRNRLMRMSKLLVISLIALIGCRSKDKPAQESPAAGARAETNGSGSAAAGSSDPSFALMRSGDGTVSATPEQTIATLRTNCNAATRDNNYAVACFSLGQLYDTGTFVARDSKVAMGLHERACTLGEMRGCAETGMFHDDGVVVPRDPSRARAYWRRACDGGNGRGCNTLILLHPEAATKEEIAYVLDRYRAICDGGGDPEACMGLGDVYRVGTHAPADASRANELYAKACNADHPTACNNLGAMLAMAPNGRKNSAEVMKLYAKACNLGSREGCLNAGIDPATAAIQIKNR